MASSKGMGIKTSVKSGNFRPTKAGAGMTEKGVKAFRKANPGSKLKTADTEDKPITSKGCSTQVFLRSLCGSNEEVSRGCQGSGQPSSSSEKKVEVLDSWK
jgi:hypothetical protein